MSAPDAPRSEPERPPDLPAWDDDYLDGVARRLAANYDLERDRTAAGERFDLYGRLQIQNRKQFVIPQLTYGHHEAVQHLLVARRDGATVADCERLVELGESLAESWIEPDERHFSTEFVLVLVVPRVDEAVRSFVADFERRTLLKYGYHGHYELRLAVVAPEREEAVASPETDVLAALRTWESVDARREDAEGVLDRLRGLFSRRS